jgi:hypothetical protein
LKFFSRFALIWPLTKLSRIGWRKNSPTRGGSTLTTPFGGLYASGNQIDLVPDATRILYCDFDLDLNVPEKRAELLHYLEDLRQEMMRLLEEEDVWIVYHPISRIVD